MVVVVVVVVVVDLKLKFEMLVSANDNMTQYVTLTAS